MATAVVSGPQTVARGFGQRGWLLCVMLALLAHLAASIILLPTVQGSEPTDDIVLYFRYSQQILAGDVPYRDFTFEYPPVAAIAFWLPGLLGGNSNLDAFRLGFAIEMALCNLAAVAAALWAWRRHLPLVPPLGIIAIWPLWLLMIGQSAVYERFDLWPAALVVIALACLLRDRPRLAWLLVGLGAASKLYPLLLAPLFLIRWRDRPRRQLALDLASCAAGIIVPTLLVTRGDIMAARGFFEYHLARGLEIESVLASLLLLGRFWGAELAWNFRFGANELSGQQAALAAAIAQPLTVIILASCMVLLWLQRPPQSASKNAAFFSWAVRGSLLLITAFVVCGKVLSPQYLLWLIPVVALLPGRAGLFSWLALTFALLMTRVLHPALWFALSEFEPVAIIVLLLRNLCLIGLLIPLGWPTREEHPVPAALASPDRAAIERITA